MALSNVKHDESDSWQIPLELKYEPNEHSVQIVPSNDLHKGSLAYYWLTTHFEPYNL